MPLTEHASCRALDYILIKLPLLTIVFLFVQLNLFAVIQPSAKTDSIYNLYEKSSGNERITYIYQLIVSGDFPSSRLIILKNEVLDICKQNPEYNITRACLSAGAFFINFGNQDSAHYYFNKAFINSKNIENPKLLFDVYYHLVYSALMKNNSGLALELLEKMKTLNEQNVELNDLSRYYYLYGIIENDKGNYNAAIDYFNLAESDYLLMKEYNRLVSVYSGIALANRRLGNIDAATSYIRKAIELEDKVSINSKTWLYYQMMRLLDSGSGSFAKKEDLLKKILELNIYLEDKSGIAITLNSMGLVFIKDEKIDSAIYYFEKSVTMYKELDIEDNMALSYHNLFTAYAKKNNNQKAIAYADSAITIFRSYKLINRLISINIDIADYYSKHNNISLADYYFNSVKVFIDTTDNVPLLMEYYLNYPSHLVRKGDFEGAYYQNKRYYILNDSIIQKKNKAKLDELYVEFETEKKEKENLLLSQSLSLEKEDNRANKTYKWYAIYLGGGLFILLLIMIHIYIYKRRDAKNSLKLKNEKLLNLEKENMLIEEQKKSAMDKLESRKNLLDVSNKHLLQQAMLSSKLIGWLKTLKIVSNKETQTIIQSNLAEVKSYSLINNWNTFEKNFAHVYPGVQESIRKAVPDLSVGDFRILCFMVMRLDNSEISMITMQSNGSLRSATYRLRNKFNVETNEELVNKLDALTGGNIIKLD